MLPASQNHSPAARRSTLIALLIGIVLTVAMWLGQDTAVVPQLGQTLGPVRWTLIVLIAGMAMLPAVRQRLTKLGERVVNPSPSQRRRIAFIVSAIAFLYLIATAFGQDRDLFPKTHDEQSYLLQMRMLAGFRLWMPQHPLADFFDTFYVLVRPVYASLYFPGASLLFVPTTWLGLPTWLMPAMVAGAIAGLVYRIVAEVIDGVAGLLAALAMLSLEFFRVYSVLLTSHEPMLFFGLLLIWAWLHWRREWRWEWAVAMGVFAGWGAITRPADAVCFAIPVGLGILLDALKAGALTATGARASSPASASSGRGRPRSGTLPPSPLPNPPPEYRRRGLLFARTAGLIVLGALPFLVLQAVFNLGVTGKLFDTPYAAYLRQDQPNNFFGFHPYDHTAKPQSIVPQKQWLYADFYKKYILRHQPEQVLPWWGRVYGPMAADTALPSRVLLIFIPVALLALRDRRSKVIAGVLPLFILLYMGNTFFLEHYAILIAPAVLLLVLLGMRRAATVAAASVQPIVRTGLTAGFITICVLSLPEFNALSGHSYEKSDETFPNAPLMHVVQDIPSSSDLQGRRAIILVHWSPGSGPWRNVQEEPVYNTQTAWPDDAPVIFAHDLGDQRNQELFRYYAQRQPDRVVFRLDRTVPTAEGLIKDLGTVKELAR